MTYRIGHKKLIRGRDITANCKIHTRNLVRGNEDSILDGIRHGIVFVGKPVGISNQCIQYNFSDFFITDVDPAIKIRELNIDPPGVFSWLTKIGRVLHHTGIYRIFKCIRITRLIKTTVGPLGKIDFEITGRFGSIRTIARNNQLKTAEKAEEKEKKKWLPYHG
jgi:hypothetical protein